MRRGGERRLGKEEEGSLFEGFFQLPAIRQSKYLHLNWISALNKPTIFLLGSRRGVWRGTFHEPG